MHHSVTPPRLSPRLELQKATNDSHPCRKRYHSCATREYDKGNHDWLPQAHSRVLATTALKKTGENRKGCQPKKVKFAYNEHTVDKPQLNAKTRGNSRNIIDISTNAPSPIGLKGNEPHLRDAIAPSPTEVSKATSVAPTPKEICDVSQRLKEPSLLGVMKSSQGGKAPNAWRDKFTLQATFGMKVVNPEVTTRKKTFLEGKFSGSHQTYSSHSTKITSTVHTDRYKIPKNIKFINHINNSKTSTSNSCRRQVSLFRPSIFGCSLMSASHDSVLSIQEHNQT